MTDVPIAEQFLTSFEGVVPGDFLIRVFHAPPKAGAVALPTKEVARISGTVKEWERIDFKEDGGGHLHESDVSLTAFSFDPRFAKFFDHENLMRLAREAIRKVVRAR
jgi:hypothetical protein